MQTFSAVVWQLLACAKPCCYTWPACRYVLCCPVWQLVHCVSKCVCHLCNKELVYSTFSHAHTWRVIPNFVFVLIQSRCQLGDGAISCLDLLTQLWHGGETMKMRWREAASSVAVVMLASGNFEQAYHILGMLSLTQSINQSITRER